MRAEVADRHGNCVFHAAARNFNPLCAMAGRVTVVEAERIVEPGELPPDAVHLPGVYVDRVIAVDDSLDKRIERRTVRPARTGAEAAVPHTGAETAVSRTDSEEK